MKAYMAIDLPNGKTTENTGIDYRQEPAKLNLADIDLKGRRVLDVAANDGFWAFWAEKQGASEVLAIDVDKYENYDWGEFKPDFNKWGKSSTDKDKEFFEIKKILNSKVKREKASVYDLNFNKHGVFDLIFMYGLLYHLRHPLLAIDRVREVCSSTFIMRTHTVKHGGNIPLLIFYEDDVCNNSITNWTGVNISCIVHWLKNAGFKYIFVERVKDGIQQVITFCGCLHQDKFYDRFKKSDNLTEISKEYFDESREKIKQCLVDN